MIIAFFLCIFSCSHAARLKVELGLSSSSTEVAALAAGLSHVLDVGDSPLVVNRAKVPIVVFLERLGLFNKHVIRPGEAVQLYTEKNGPHPPLPYRINALVGDESALPSDLDSLKSFSANIAVPAVFATAVGLSIFSGGLTGAGAGGAAAAGGTTLETLAYFLSYFGLPDFGVFGGKRITPEIALASIRAGTKFAKIADDVGHKIVRAYPRMFMAKKRFVMPGVRYFEIIGGPNPDNTTGGTDLKIAEITPGQYSTYNIEKVLPCIEEASETKTLTSDFMVNDCGDKRAVGEWFEDGDRHSGRPRYRKVDDPKWIVEWSKGRKAWRMFYDETLFGHGRKSLYESKENTGSIPDKGWEICKKCIGGLPLPSIQIVSD